MSNESSDEMAWTLVHGERSGAPFVLRYLSKSEPVERLETLLRIVWIYAEEDSGALPDTEQSNAMQDFENLLVEHFEQDGIALLTAALTLDGARQWVWYTSDISECAKRLNSLPPTEEPFPIELDSDQDPEWLYLNETILSMVK